MFMNFYVFLNWLFSQLKKTRWKKKYEMLDHLYTDHEIDILHREVRVYSVFSLLQVIDSDVLHIKSEYDILQNPGFEVYHIRSEVYHVAVTWQTRCLDLQHADIGRRIRNGRRHSMLTTSTG